MRTGILGLVLLICSCDSRQQENPIVGESSKASIQRESIRQDQDATQLTPAMSRKVDSVRDTLMESSDIEASDFINTIELEPSSVLRRQYMIELYEDALMREPSVKLANLLIIAMHEDSPESLKHTAQLQLSGALQADYGEEWGAWGLAIRDYLGGVVSTPLE